MSTRSSYLVIKQYTKKNSVGAKRKVQDKLLNIYVHWDGYPTGHPVEVADYLASGEVANGIPVGQEGVFFNGSTDVAASLVAFLKTKNGSIQPGNVYVNPIDSFGQCWEDYTYKVIVDEDDNTITFQCSDIGFKGNPADFRAFAEKKENA